MIEVQEQPELTEFRTAKELHSALIRYHGRVLRFRSSQVRPEDNPYGRSYRNKRTESDVIGKLIGLNLLGSASWNQGDQPRESSHSLYLKLEGTDTFSVSLSIALIEVLQEDSGLWKLVHRGSSWPKEESEIEA